MLGSNQRPLPCESRSITSWLFVVVQKHLQISIFSLADHRGCSLLFAWVGVLLVYQDQPSPVCLRSNGDDFPEVVLSRQ
jgi:hypothetical protein